MRGLVWGSDGEAEDQDARARLSGPRPPSSMSTYRTQPADKYASAGHDVSVVTIPVLHCRRRSRAEVVERSGSAASHTRAGANSFPDPHSPKLSGESNERTREVSPAWHRGHGPSTFARSSAGSSFGSSAETGDDAGDSSGIDTGSRTIPEPRVGVDMVSTTFVQDLSDPRPDLARPDAKSTRGPGSAPAPRRRQAKDKAYDYGTPEMPRGNVNLPHLPPNALGPRVSNPGQGHVNHLPRAEKLPLTGYELLAAHLSTSSSRNTSRPRRHGTPRSSRLPLSPATDSGGCGADAEPHIKPIYRRFEALNHRLLLYLQDELSELEEQLHRLDTADTQTRRLQNCILPASRRAEHTSGGELQWHKTDILGKIGFKLGQYNHALSSFGETQRLPSAELADVEAYRTYLATDNPIAEMETRFLDPTDDLVCLAGNGGEHRPRSDSNCSSSSYEPRRGRCPPPALSDEAATPRQGSLAGLFSKTTRFPFVGSPGGACLPTPSLSPTSSVAGRSRPSTGAAADEVKLTEAPAKDTTALGLMYVLLAASVILPGLLLRAVGGIAARLAVVLVLTAIAGLLGPVLITATRPVNPRGIGTLESNSLVYTGAYGAVLAVIAAVC